MNDHILNIADVIASKGKAGIHIGPELKDAIKASWSDITAPVAERAAAIAIMQAFPADFPLTPEKASI